MKSTTTFLSNAKKYLGVSGRPNKFTQWYANKVASDSGFLRAPWCDMFVSYVAMESGLSKEVGRFAFCPFHVAWFKKQKRWGKTPKVGAIAFFDWDRDGKADHVGIVEAVKGNTVITIEGNKNDGVRRVVRSSGVLGYGYPPFPGGAVPPTYTVQEGDSLSSIAFHFYGDYGRWRDIYKMNRKAIGPNPGMIRPGMKLALPKT
jgi:nucleoid-associated protein YgaU